MADRLRIGRISYLNLHPIFHELQRGADCSRYEFVEGYPSMLNGMLREGRLDVSPSSSIEYLRASSDGHYGLIHGHSISARGAIRSILFLSRLPMEDLGGATVYATHESETSTALLAVILGRLHGIRCNIDVTRMPFEKALESHTGYLAIGDEALRAWKLASDLGVKEDGYRIVKIGLQMFYVYDLAELWAMRTGLPFVFALWMVRPGLDEEGIALARRLQVDLDGAKGRALGRLGEIARSIDSPLGAGLIESYWRDIEYGLDDACKRGLELFGNYLVELDLL